MNSALSNRHEGQAAWIIGKGPSLEHLRAEHIQAGPIITLNHAILAVESLNLPNKIYSLQKDGGCARPQSATLVLHDKESGDAFPDYPDRHVFSLSELGFPSNVFSLSFALRLAKYMGCTRFCFVCCDLHANGGRRTYLPGKGISDVDRYGAQKELFPQYLYGLIYEFITPQNLTHRRDTMTKLNLGCGYGKMPGYTNIDNRPEVEPDMCCDVLAGLPFDDNSVDEIRAYDFLEHVPTLSTIAVMEDFWRVLKPGGKLDTFTPDAEHGQGAFMDPTHVNFWVEGRWMYFTDPRHRRLYGIKAQFEVEHLRRILTHEKHRIYHLHVVAKAVK